MVYRSKTCAWAFTVKKNSGKSAEVKVEDYDNIFNRWIKFKITPEYKIGEKDKNGRLHYHGIVHLPKGFYRKKLTAKDPTGSDYHLKLVELTDRKGWLKYIHKDIEFKHLEDRALEMEDTEISIDDEDTNDNSIILKCPRLFK